MKTINELIKENKLFTGKVYDKLKPVERDAIHDIIKFVEEDKSNIDLVVISTPTKTHYEMANYFLKSTLWEDLLLK